MESGSGGDKKDGGENKKGGGDDDKKGSDESKGDGEHKKGEGKKNRSLFLDMAFNMCFLLISSEIKTQMLAI